MSADFENVSSMTQSTTRSNKQIYEMVVDPDRAHLGESFVIDMRKMGSAVGGKEKAVDDIQKASVVENLLRFSASGPVMANSPKKVGRAIPNIQDIDHSHPANPIPASVSPPQVKVFFDMPGLGSISFKYHKVLTLRDQIVFVTDKRFGGSAEFYPYCNMRSGEHKKPVGVYVEGDKNLYLLDPSIKGFPIKFDCDPYELCIVPLAGAKPLDSAMMKELGIVNSAKGESSDGEESGNTRGPDASEFGPSDGKADDTYESLEGGFGGVL